MVHRPADSRLLANLLVHEKEYAKRLIALSDSSHVSVTSLSAYAAASPTSIAQVVLALAGVLASADNALQRYAASVNEWRQRLKDLKDLEDEVGNIVRDREILVTRLLKASKTQKSPARDIHGLLPTSTSTASLKSDLSFSPNPYHKLTAAQSELLACEAHLAAKELELWQCRARAVREGLFARCTGMVECGHTWSELGNEAIKVLDGMGVVAGDKGTDVTRNLDFDADPSMNINTSTPSRRHSSVTMPRLSSDLTSLTPSQSTTLNYVNGAGPVRQDSHVNANDNAGANDHPEADPDDNTSATFTNTNLQILPAHAISEFVFPTSQINPPVPPPPATVDVPAPMTMPIPSFSSRVLPRRITEEDLHQDYSAEQEGSSIEEVIGPLQVVENSQFATHPSSLTHDTHGSSKRFSIRNVIKSGSSAPRLDPEPTILDNTQKRDRKASNSSTSRFFGSLRLRGLFRRDFEETGDADFSGSPRLAGGGAQSKRWATRTDRNLKKMKAGEKGESSDEGTIVRPPSPGAVSPLGPSAGYDSGGGRRLKKKGKRRTRSEGVGSIAAINPVVSRVQASQRHDKNAPDSGDDERRTYERVSDGGVVITHSHGVDTGARTVDEKKLIRHSSKSQKHGIGDLLATGSSGSRTGRRSSLDVVTGHDTDMDRGRFKEIGTSRNGRRAMSMDEQSRSAGPSQSRILPIVKEGTTKNRGFSSKDTLAVFDVGEEVGETSLMSIVEGVAKQNRDGWVKYVQSQEVVGGDTRPNVDNNAKGRGEERRGQWMPMVKAPPPISRDDLNAMMTKPTTTATARISNVSVGPYHPAAQYEGTGDINRLVEPSTKPEKPTTKTPLRSALRNASRTPSPLPPAVLLLASDGGLGKSSARRSYDRGRKRRSVLVVDERGERGSDEEASESSYETGHETFDDDEDGKDGGSEGEETDRALPAPPPPDKPGRVTRHGNLTSTQNQDRDRNRNFRTQSPEVAVTSTANDRDRVAPPVRRKSVRVSLQPTFSPTPPAVDDDSLSSPWGHTVNGGGGGGGGWQSRVGYPRGNGDIWEDSSEEDEKYQTARRLLMSKVY